MIICFELKKRNKVKADAWKEMGTSDTINKPEAEKEVIVPPADKSGAETASINLRTLFFGEKSGLVNVQRRCVCPDGRATEQRELQIQVDSAVRSR
jgi:hypothetical protein